MTIVCPNLHDKNVAKEFAELVKAVGEDAAYQIWSLNNGNGIDKAPNGEPSILFDNLLQRHSLQKTRDKLTTKINNLKQQIELDGSSEEIEKQLKQLQNEYDNTFVRERFAAIKDKAITYADNYVKLSSDENGEVDIKDLYRGFPENDLKELGEKIDRRSIDYHLRKEHEKYVEDQVINEIKNNPNISNPYILRAARRASIDWATKRQQEIIGYTQKKLIEAFGIVEKDGDLIIPDDNSENAKLRIQFVKGITEHGYIDTYKQNEIDHYIISIGLLNGDATTFNHELAHYYIRKFRNSKLVQAALDEYAKDGMSIDEIEEALVDVITERSIHNEWGSNLENQTFFHKFWYGFNNMLYRLFGIKNKAHKAYISDQITQSFIINEQLQDTELDAKYQLSYERMYQSEYRKRMESSKEEAYRPQNKGSVEETIGQIINSTRSKQKSYESRFKSTSGSTLFNTKQSIRNKEAQRAASEVREEIESARKNSDVSSEKRSIIKLYHNFLSNADKEISEVLAMMQNAKANDYRRLYYISNPDGSIRYRSIDENPLTESSSETGMLSHDYTFDDLEYAKTDVIGQFRPIIDQIYINLDAMIDAGFDPEDIEALREFIENSRILNHIEDIRRIWEQALEKKVSRTIDNIVDDRVDLDQDRKTRLRINMYKWLREQMDYGDVKSAEVFIGMGSRSKSPILRAVQDIIYQMEDEKTDKAYEVETELDTLRREAEKSMGWKYRLFYNVQKLLMQLDENGLPTGYLIQPINKALYYKDRDKFRDNLLFGEFDSKWKFNHKSIEQQIKDITLDDGTKLVDKDWTLKIDASGTPILPSLTNPDCARIYKNYMREFERWLDQHEDRQYTLQYYYDRIDTLSPVTLQALYSINKRITDIISTCIQDGLPNYNLLTKTQIQQLKSLDAERDELANFYDLNNEVKTGDDFTIANELMQWNKKTEGKLVYITDTDNYERCRNAATDKQEFDRNFSNLNINPEIWNLIKQGKHSPIPQSDPRYKRLRTIYYQKAKLLNRYRGEIKGDVAWDEIFDKSTGRLKNLNFWKVLQQMDEKINELQNILWEEYGDSTTDEDAIKYGDILKTVNIPKNFTTDINWNDPIESSKYDEIHQALVDNYASAVTEEERNDIVKEIQYLTILNIHTGHDVPIDIFSVTVPRFDKIKHKNVEYDVIVRQPRSIFRKLDVQNSSSEYVNKSFVPNQDGTIQPKKDLYKDSRWEIVEKNEKLKAFYDKLVSVYKDAWNNLPVSMKYDYRLSQMGGFTGEILGRNMRSNFLGNVATFFKREFSVVETDLEFRPTSDREKRPDGSDIENIPIRFLKLLDEPRYITSNLVYSTGQFYEMALNFKIKSQHLSQLISIYRRLDQNEIADTYKSMFDSKQSEVLKGMLDRQVYEKLTSISKSANQYVNETGKADKQIFNTGTARDWLKRVGKLRISLQLGMLALNLPSALVSFADPFISLLIDIVTGKYINGKDVVYALGQLLKDFPRAVFGLPLTRPYAKSVAGMQRMGLSSRPINTFRKAYQSPILRFFTDGPLMKGFTLGDYTMNSINLISTMHNYKYYKDSQGNAAFYPKHIYIQKVMQDRNCTTREARGIYNNAINMYAVYKINDKGQFVPDTDGEMAEYGKAVSKQVETQVKKQTRSRSAIYNGLVPDAERTLMQTNVFLAFFSMLRNFMITGFWERFQTYRDFQVASLDEEGNPIDREATVEEREKARVEQNYYKGGYSFETISIENAITWAGIYGFRHASTNLKYMYMMYKNKYTEADTYARENKVSDQDVYAMQKMFLESLCWLSLMLGSSITGKMADDDKNDYLKQLINLFILRLSVERYTWYSPTTAMELLKSPTTAMSDWERKMKIVALGEDLVTYISTISSLQETGPWEQPVKQGYYWRQPRWKRDLYSVLSSTGINNWYKSMPESLGGSGAHGLRETQKFYKSLRPDWYDWFEDAAFKDDNGNWTDW